MKNQKTILMFLIVMVCCGMQSLKAQNIYFNFSNGNHASYALSTVRSITFTNDVMNLNKKDGTTVSWNVNTIHNYNYTGETLNVQEVENNELTDVNIYPNPSKGPIHLQFPVEQAGVVTMELTDLSGKLIKILPAKQYAAGIHTITWDATDENGDYFKPGIYFFRIITDGMNISKKIIITN